MSGRALIIDRDTTFADQLADELSREGYDVQTCDTGREGIEHAKTDEPDLIVLCVELEDTSGYSICAKIKKDIRLKNIPLIITSERATQETFDHHRKLKTRAQAYLMKPFEPSELIAELRGSTSTAKALSSSNMPPPLPPTTGSVELPEVGLEPLDVDPEMTTDGDDIDSDFERTLASYSKTLPRPMETEGIGSGINLREEFDEDEVRTTIGTLPATVLEQPVVPTDYDDSLDSADDSALGELKSRLFDVERERDDALAGERALQAQLEALTAGQQQLPNGEANRELIATKKELNAKERELLELRDNLQQRDRQLLVAKEKEAELEEQIFQADEERSKADQARLEAEGRIAGAEARAEQIDLTSKATINGLREELTSVRGSLDDSEMNLNSARELGERLNADLDEAHEVMAQRAQTIEERDQQIAELRSELDQTRSEYEQTSAELEQVRGELDQTRTQLTRRENELEDFKEQQEGLIRRLEASELEGRNQAQVIESMRRQISGLERQLNEARQRHHDEADIRDKARRAVEIGLNLLNEADYPESSSDLAKDVDEPSTGETLSESIHTDEPL